MLKSWTRAHPLASLVVPVLISLLPMLVRGRGAAEAAPAALIAALPPATAGWRRELAVERFRADGSGFVQVLHDGGHVELTLDPRVQPLAERVLREHDAPYAAAVLLSVEDGRVLAMAGRSSAEPERSSAELTLQPWAPAASIFKLVTAAALLEDGLRPDTRVCYHDGVHSIEPSNLVSHPLIDRACGTLAFAVAKSQNAIIARLAHDHLRAQQLDELARAFGFGQPLPLELSVGTSDAPLPTGDLAFARAAAGFWSTTLSPLHGAYLAATIARGGETPPLRLVERVVDRAGNSLRPAPVETSRVLSEATARAVSTMMVGTTEYGTAKVAFRARSGRPLLPGILVAGKTGSLNRVGRCSSGVGCASPFVSYSWFVGFAPADHPKVAIAVLLGNGLVWRVKAHQVARELLAGYFAGEPKASPSRSLAARVPPSRSLAAR